MRGGVLRRFRRSGEGATMVEFALVAPVFLLLLFSIMELAMISFGSSTLRNGLSVAARDVRTGNAQCTTNAEFRNRICRNAGMLPNCVARLTVDNQNFPFGFGTVGLAAMNPGDLGGGSVVLVRAEYRWDVLSPFVEPIIADGNGEYRFRQSFVFQTEDFGPAACS